MIKSKKEKAVNNTITLNGVNDAIGALEMLLSKVDKNVIINHNLSLEMNKGFNLLIQKNEELEKRIVQLERTIINFFRNNEPGVKGTDIKPDRVNDKISREVSFPDISAFVVTGKLDIANKLIKECNSIEELKERINKEHGFGKVIANRFWKQAIALIIEYYNTRGKKEVKESEFEKVMVIAHDLNIKHEYLISTIRELISDLTMNDFNDNGMLIQDNIEVLTEEYFPELKKGSKGQRDNFFIGLSSYLIKRVKK